MIGVRGSQSMGIWLLCRGRAEKRRTLTISGHAHGQTLLEATLLAAVAVDPHNGAVLHLQALLVLDVLLDASPEEALPRGTPTDQVKQQGCVTDVDSEAMVQVFFFLLSDRKSSHLAALAGVHTIVKARGHIAAHLAQQYHAVDFCANGE